MGELPRGTVTLLFTDIEESTRMLQRAGEGYASLLETCRSLLRAAFLEFNGHEVDTQGDAFFVAFARATDAVSAAVAAQRALFTQAWPDGITLRVRMGLHTGEPQLASLGYVGLDVHHAARIMSAGHGGQVLLSQTTRDLVEHILPEGVSLLDMGSHRLKDLQQPGQLFQLVISGLPTDFPPLKTLDNSLNNLPIQPTPFIGREKEVDAVQQLLLRQEVRLVTLTGTGGIGKTRLALQGAADLTEHFADGTWFVSLDPISDPDRVIPTIIQTLGLREVREHSPLEQLKDALQVKQMLLLLDNFEQVIRAAPLVADLLTACPHIKMLITSREGLHVRAEREFPLPTLALPDTQNLPDVETLSHYEAVALFIERAQAIKPDFQVTNANAQAVAEICARLDGLPLAIELAAARIKLFPPQALLARLTQLLPLLTRSARDVPARQQTLRQTIQWSYDLLIAEEQCLFRLLSVFISGCSWQAIEVVSEVCEVETLPVLDTVASLIDKNLVQQSMHEGQEIRLTMLETIREYGLEMLSSSGERVTAQQAHAAYYLNLAEEAAPQLKGPQQAEWLERLAQEHDNLRVTLMWLLDLAQAGSNPERALRLVVALEVFWDIRGLYNEGLGFLRQAIAGSEGFAASLRARALRAAASFADMQVEYNLSEALFQESLALSRQLGDTRGIASSLRGLGSLVQLNNYPKACSLFEESLALYQDVGDKEASAWLLQNLASAVSVQGDYRKGQALFNESLVLFRELGNKQGIAFCLQQSARILFFARGDQAIIRTRLEESDSLQKELGDKNGMAYSIWTSGWVALSQGNAATANALVEQSLVLWQEMGNRWHVFWSLAILGRIKTYQGDFATALAFHEKSLTRACEYNDFRQMAFGLEGLAYAIAAMGDVARAAQLWSLAESLRERCGTPLSPLERAEYEPAVAAARIQLGEQAFAVAWGEGRSLTLEQVLAALEQTRVVLMTSADASTSSVEPSRLSLSASEQGNHHIER